MVLQKKGVTMRSNQVTQLEKKELTSTYTDVHSVLSE